MKLEIKNLSKTYKNGTKALQNISLTIENGMFGLLGQNGAGKSTLMRTITTLQEPDSGNILFNNFDIFKHPMKLKQTLGYLPQDFGVYPSISAYEMLMHLADMKGINNKSERKEIVSALLNKVNLWKARKNNLGAFSGGMKQRFGIAQALLNNPKLIIVDEPTAGLDPKERNRFYNILSELSEDSIVILSTHIVEDVSTLCNKMAIIGHGKVLLHGTPYSLEEALDQHLWISDINKEDFDYYNQNFTIISSRFFRGKMQITVVSQDMPNRYFKKKKPNLEDVYFYELHPNKNKKLYKNSLTAL